MFNKIKEKKGGFTLVELIIVLVILAVLAAFLVPTLTGYVDKANDTALVSETRLAVMAAQSLADEVYATGGTPKYDLQNNTGNVTNADIKALAEVEGTIKTITFDTTNTSKIATLTYTSKDGKKQCDYTLTPAAGKEKYEVKKVTN